MLKMNENVCNITPIVTIHPIFSATNRKKSITLVKISGLGRNSLNRRRFIIASAGVAGVAAIGTAGWLVMPRSHSDLTVASVIQQLQALELDKLTLTGAWNAYQTFNHMAQSVEYSMTGYPEHKSDIFKSVVGQAAFSVFSSKGMMSHDLAEPIPGAPALQVEGPADIARQRLIDALITFDNFQGKLQQHFAFGTLSKSEYEVAHAMHVYNHFTEFELA